MTRRRAQAIVTASFGIFVLAGCTAIQVRPVDRAANLKHVCIQDNPKVTVPDFVTVVRDGFSRHGITTEVFSGVVPERCEYVLTYTARRSWDIGTYLSIAELTLDRNRQQVGFAQYRLRGKGGLSLMKWQGVKTKMDPVMDELLKAYR